MYDYALWVEKYRPKTVNDIIVPSNIKKEFKSMVETNNIPHMIFYGDPGLGKTSMAKALVNDLDVDYLFINGSLERSIDIIRSNVIRHLSTQSPLGKFKVIIIDEVDGLTSDAQNSLKSTIEQYKDNGRFIFTTNHIDRVIDPLRSRLVEYNFNIKSTDEKKELHREMFTNATKILQNENIKFSSEDLNKCLIEHFPDFRKIVSILQKNIIDGQFIYNENEVIGLIKKIKDALKKNSFDDLKVIVHSIDSVSAIDNMYMKLYNNMNSFVKPESYRTYVKILSDHMYQNKNTISKHVNLLDCLLDIAERCKFK